MSCLNCHAELPVGAMFCGECGRATSSRGAAPARPTSVPAAAAAAATAEEMWAAPTAKPVATPATAAAAGDTIALDRNWLSAEFDLYPTTAYEPAPVLEVIVEEAEPEPEPEPEPEIELEVEVETEPETEPELEPQERPATVDADADDDDNELTRIVSRRGVGERFVFQFSTGESATVFGSGLLGRNPMPQPGEKFDQLVVLSDPGKSVSKTHLEFGQENGTFWMSDRFSANGTVIREPDAAPHRCDPGKRYRIVRGTRIDLGEQFVVVS